MKRIALLTITMTLPFSCFGGKEKDGWNADAGKHLAEPASKNIENGLTEVAGSIHHAAEAIETSNETLKDVISDNIGFLIIAVPVVAVAMTAHTAGWYAWHYANGTLDAELEKHKAEQERYRKESEEYKLKQLQAVQEATRLKRNAEIETEFNSCFANRFNSPTRKRNGIPSSCELQGSQLVGTGKFKSMQDLKNYYKS